MKNSQEAEQGHQHRLTTIDERYGVRVASTQDEVDRLQTEWSEIKSSEERLPRYSSPLFYWPFMAILAVAEAPLNRLSFELFFVESPIVSFGVALLCGAILMSLAHFLGLGICRFRYNLETQQKKTGNRRTGLNLVLVILGLSALIYALCYGIAILRQGYLTFALGEDPSFAEMLETERFTQAALHALSSSLQVEGFVFLAINLGVVGVGTFAAIFCHDPHPDYERIDRLLKAARKDLAFNKKILAEARAREERRYAEELELISERDMDV